MNTPTKLNNIIDFADTSVKFEVCDNKDNTEKKILVIYFENNTKYLIIDEFTHYILKHLNSKKTFEDIFNSLKQFFKFEESIFELFETFKSTLVFSYLFENNKVLNETKKDKYIYPKINLIQSKHVNKVSIYLSFLFHHKLFWLLFSLLPIGIILFFYYEKIGFNSLYQYISASNSLVFYFGYILCVLLHEFGHASATLKFGAKPNNIGFGFYLISPVFYCDVSDIWRLKRQDRIIVDLAGIYLQWLISSVFILLYYFTKDQFFVIFSFFNFVSSLINLNPFLLYDGYWALSDIIGVSNLRTKAFAELKRFVLSIIRFNFYRISIKEFLFIVYSSLSFGMLILFFYYMIFLNTDSIVYFFYNIYQFIKNIILSYNSISFEYIKGSITSFIAPTVFYWLSIKLIINKIKKWKTN